MTRGLRGWWKAMPVLGGGVRLVDLTRHRLGAFSAVTVSAPTRLGGTADFVFAPNAVASTNLNEALSAVTVFFWIYADDPGSGDSYPIRKGSSPVTGFEFKYEVSQDRVMWRVWPENNINVFIAPNSLFDGTWHSVGCINTGATSVLRVDASFTDSAAAEYTSDTTQLSVGIWIGGRMDDVLVYDRALSGSGYARLRRLTSLPRNPMLNWLQTPNAIVPGGPFPHHRRRLLTGGTVPC